MIQGVDLDSSFHAMVIHFAGLFDFVAAPLSFLVVRRKVRSETIHGTKYEARPAFRFQRSKAG